MAISTKIHLMISSRCETEIEFQGKPQKLTEVRRALKKQLEEYRLPNQKKAFFECWINEDGTGGTGSNCWDHCLKQARDANLVIVLYTGAAGSGLRGSDMGICHAELEAAMNVAANRVRVIKLPSAPSASDALQNRRDDNFANYFGTLGHFQTSAKNGEDVLEKVWNEIQTALVGLVQLGSSSFHLSQGSTGHALKWHRLSYEDRKQAMEDEMTQSLSNQPKAAKSSSGVFVEIAGAQVFVKSHAAPVFLG